MLKICLVIIAFAETAWCVNFKIVCENEIKPWILYDKAPERPKPQFDAEDIKFYLYNKNNPGVLLDVGAATTSPPLTTTSLPSSSITTDSSSSISTTDSLSSTITTPSASSPTTTDASSSISTTDSISSTIPTPSPSSPATTDASSSISTTDSLSSTIITPSPSSPTTTDASSSISTTDSLSSTITTSSSSSSPTTTDASSSISTTDSLSSTITTPSPPSPTTTDASSSISTTDSLTSTITTPSPPSQATTDASSSISTTDSPSSTITTPSPTSPTTTDASSSISITDSLSSTITTPSPSLPTTTDASSSISTTDSLSSTITTPSPSSQTTTDASSSISTTDSLSSTITTPSLSSPTTTDASSSISTTDSLSSTTTTPSPSLPTTTDASSPCPSSSMTTTTQKPVYDDSRQSGNLNLIDKALKTVFVVHGWFENHEEQWISNLTQLLVTSSNAGVNVVALDYSKYSNDYFKASVQVVKDIAQAIANFLKIMADKDLVKIEDTYFIGFGLGAHVSGVVGKELQKLIPNKKLARITGLDPVGFLFDSVFADKLGMSDAKFVDVVKTNSDWLGSNRRFGQATFQMNDGKRQPKCKKTKACELKKIFKKQECTYAYNLMRCSHLRSTEYWAESVLLNNFVHKKSGIVMGVNGNIGVSGEFMIKTRDKPPYGRGK